MSMNDIQIVPSTLTDGSKVFAVVYDGFINGFQQGTKITFHMEDEAAAQRLHDALDGVTGVEVEAK